MDYNGWIAERRKYVTASQAAVVLDRSPWQTKQELAREKLGMVEPWAGNQSTWMGQHFEEPNAKAFEAATGIRCRLSKRLYDSFPLAATPDGFCYPVESTSTTDLVKVEWSNTPEWGDDESVLEMKNVSAWTYKSWKPFPEYYWWQVQTQLYCTGLDNGLLVAKIDAHRLLASHIKRDNFALDLLVEKAAEFMENLEEYANGTRS